MNQTLFDRLYGQSKSLILVLLAVAFFASCLLPSASLAAATITFVQSNDAVPQTPQTSVAVTYTAAQAAGDLNVVAVGWNDTTATVSTVTDKSGNTYTRAVGPTPLTGLGSQSIYYAKNIAAAAAGANIVTVTFSSAAASPDVRILEYSGADPSNPVDVTAAATGSAATSSSGSATTTNATDLIFGADLVSDQTTGPGTGFTKRLLTSPDGDIAEDETVTATGSYAATAPIKSGTWIMQMVAFRTPTGGGTAPTVTGISPNTGSTAGGTPVTITGTNFASGATVNFGATAATNVVVVSATSITASTPAASAGAVTVTVTVASQSGSLTNGFTYIGTPTVISVSPSTGSTAGGTAVTITGTNFASGATVKFGANAATNVVVASGTSITATTPAGSVGAVTVTVTNTGGFSGSLTSGFTYAVLPTVTSVSPNTGLTAGGTAVTITGANFASGATVNFGATAATNVVVVSATSITASTPPGTAGPVTVTVTVGGQSGSLANGFTYIGLPTVTSVSPNSGPTAGATAVTITGTNFATGATVTFGTTAATSVVVVSSTSITAKTPAGTSGAVTVTVTNPLAQSGSLPNGFTYVTVTTITYVQGNSATPQTPQTSVPVTFTAAQTAGDLNVVAVGWNDSTATVTSVTDKSGNTYTLAVGPTIQSGIATQSIYYAKNINAAAAGANIVTVTFSTAAIIPDVRILEYKGADPTNPVDVTAAATGSGTTSSSGAATTTNATDLIFGANLVQATTTGPGTGFTSRLLTSPDADIAEDEMVTAVGSYTATAKVTTGQWIMQMVAFRTSAGGGTGPTVTSVSPSTGSTAGATAVTITGTNFASGATVKFGANAATNVVVASSTSITATTPAGSAGAVTVTVTVASQSGSLTNGFTYIGTPTVISVSPSTGSTAGGTAVTITGTNFASGATVQFGANAATNVVVASSTSITATTPAGSVGAVTVTVTNTGGFSGSLTSGFTYAVLPTVTSVSPNTGLTAGGTAVTITGANFASGATVNFGATAATNVVVVSATSITASTPPGTAGAVTVTVTVGGQSGSLANGFTYIGLPTVTSVSPNSGPTAGATAVTITGTNFATGATVTFGTTAATNVVVVSGTSITASTPAGTVGAVTVTVTDPLAQSGSMPNGFTYVAVTNITFVQGNSATPQTPQASVPVTFTAAQSAGDLNVVAVGWNDSTATVTSVTDKSGNTYTLAVGPTIQSGIATQSIYYAKNIVAAAAGANIVTVTFSTAAVFPDIRVLEYKGADANTPVDVTGAGSGSGTTSSSAAVTTTNATDLIFGANLVQTTTSGPGTGFTKRLLTSPDADIAEDEMVTAIGTYSATAPLSSGGWIMQMVAFRTPDPPPTVPTNLSATAVSMSQINLSWTASTDGVGVTAYLVERCTGVSCSNFVQIGTSPTTNYSDMGLATSTPYSYRVRATDADANLSGYSNIASTTTQGVSPTAPTNVSAVDGGPAPIVVAVQGLTDGNAVTTHSTAAFNSTGGDLIVLCADASAGVTFTPSDNFGNTWISIAGPTSTAQGSDLRTQIWYAPNAIVGPNHVITVTLSTGEPLVMSVIVVKDSNISSPIDVTSLIGSDNGSKSASVTSPSIATSLYNDLLIGFAKNASGATFTAGSGFTLLTGASSAFLAAETAPAATAGNYAATFLLSAGQTWQAAITAVGYNPNQTTLSWTGSTESGGTIANYLVQRCQGGTCSNFALVGTIPATSTTFNDTGLLPSTTYSYRIQAQDTLGVTGPFSTPVTVTTPIPITPPQNLSATPASSTQINLTWTAAVETGGTINQYAVQRCLANAGANSTGQPCTSGFVTIATIPASPTTYSDTGLTGGTFNYRVQAIDTTGNLSPFSNTATASVPDTTQPTTPGGLTATPAATTSQISLNWTGSTDNVGVTGYLVERCQGGGCNTYTQIAVSTTTTYSDIGLNPNTSYSYRVQATDAAGNLSVASNIATASTPNLAAPTAPTSLSVVDGGPGPVVVAVQSYINTASLTTHTAAAFNSTGGDLIVMSASSHAGVTFTPTDNFGNTWIPLAGPTSTTMGADLRTVAWYAANAIVGPGHVVTMNLSGAEPLVISIIVVKDSNITSPIDAVSAIGSDNGTQSANVVSPSILTSLNNDLLIGFAKVSGGATFTAGAGFTLQAAASSNFLAAETAAAANSGSYAATFTITGQQTWQAAIAAVGYNPNQTTLSWTAATEPGGTLANYLVQRCLGDTCTNFVQVGSVPATSTTFNDTGLLPATTYSYRVVAEDTADSLGPFSTVVTVTTPVPITPPQNLSATPASSTQINLAWTAATEPIGTINQYVVQRCLANAGTNSTGQPCTSGFVTIATIPASPTTYSDTGLTGGTFNYRVQAIDMAGNLSPFSNTATASVPDTTQPTAPSGLTATPATTASQITLNWTGSMDNVGVTGYLIERCQGGGCNTYTQIGTSTTTTFTDMGLAANTSYTYVIQATDAAGNLSVASNSATASTANLATPSAPTSVSAVEGNTGPTVVAAQSLTDGSSTTSHTTAAFNSAGGNLIVLCIDSLGGVTMTPSDSFGNTWISIAGPTSTTTGSDLRTQLWYAWNPMVGPGHTVTVTLSKGEPVVMAVLVVQNANVSSPIDGVSLIGSDNGTSSVAVTSPNIVTTLNNDLLLGFAKDAVGATFTAGAGFTLQAAASSQFLAAETGVAATPGTYNATFTLSTGQTWQALITAAANNPNQATVSWTASTEPSGTIANYLVWRCQGPGCNNYAQIATVPATSTTFNDLGLTPGTMYSYEVQAEDAAFTVGPFSTAAIITTPAAIPSLPGSLTVGAASGTQNILSWTASLETGGGTIFQYLVESCQGLGCNSFSQIGTSPTPGYTDNSVSPGVSYTYRVRAQDAAGTLGPYSNVASDVTP